MAKLGKQGGSLKRVLVIRVFQWTIVEMVYLYIDTLFYT